MSDEVSATTVVAATSGEEAAKKVKGVCDIVFLVDTTGSMQPAINDLKKNIKLFFKTLSNGDENGNAIVKDWRFDARAIAMPLKHLNREDLTAVFPRGGMRFRITIPHWVLLF